MPAQTAKAAEIQREYYAATAAKYDSMHGHEAANNPQTFKYVTFLLRAVQPETVLDVGAGTGQAILKMKKAMPDLSISGVEPVTALIEQGERENGLPAGTILQGVGENLPFADASFDVVCSFGILHHVPHPNAIVKEMMRVARKAILICDGNRFGQGSLPMRLLKLGLYKAGLWRTVNYLKTGGKGYQITPGDGLAYSYSVYDSFACISDWAEQVVLLPSVPHKAKSWIHPLLTSEGILIFASKSPVGGQNVSKC
jgi:ubiquinone/menaquinone biosynthesis C-methylase UbiE